MDSIYDNETIDEGDDELPSLLFLREESIMTTVKKNPVKYPVKYHVKNKTLVLS